MIEPERVDVRHRIECEASGTAGGVVAEPQGDDAVRDLVQDDGRDQARKK